MTSYNPNILLFTKKKLDIKLFVCVCCMCMPVTCQTDFVTQKHYISWDEKILPNISLISAGSLVGTLNLDRPETINTITVLDGNAYFDYLPTNNSFVVTSRIDIDRGLNTVQLMILECMPFDGPRLEVSKPETFTCTKNFYKKWNSDCSDSLLRWWLWRRMSACSFTVFGLPCFHSRYSLNDCYAFGSRMSICKSKSIWSLTYFRSSYIQLLSHPFTNLRSKST